MAGAAPKVAAAAGTATGLSLLNQSPWVTPLQARSGPNFTLEVNPGRKAPAGADLTVTLYDLLHTRSAFEQALSGSPTGELDRTSALPVSKLPPGPRGGVQIPLDVVPRLSATPGTGQSLDLACTPFTGQCSGVYPVVVSLTRAGGGTLGHFTTFLTYTESPSATKLNFAWVAPISAPVTIRRDVRDPGKALVPPSRTRAGALTGLIETLASRAHSTVPVTVQASPQTLQGLAATGSAGALSVRTLALLSSNQQLHEVLAQPYVPIDLGALAGAGEPTEVVAQMAAGAGVDRDFGMTTASPAWVATGSVGNNLASGLATIGSRQVVVPDSDLAPLTSAQQAQTTGTWASTFQLSLGRSSVVQGAVSDSELALHFTSDPSDPALEANQLLADLALIHFEEPTHAGRGVVAVPPSGWTPNATFDNELLAGLNGNPDVQPVTLSGYFSSVAAATGSTAERRLSSTGQALPRGFAQGLSTARERVTGFDSAVFGNAPIKSQLDQLLLASQSKTLRPAAQRAGLASFGRALSDQLSLIQLATERTITLTARTAPLPITILSSAPYPVVVNLTLTGDKFLFPQGASRSRILIDHSTTPIRIVAQARTSGDLPLNAVLTAPNGTLLIARGQFTVRSTATSVVGVVLTVLALAVLAGWWLRTSWMRRRRPAMAGDHHEGPGS